MSNYIYGAGNVGAKVVAGFEKYGEPLNGFLDSFKTGEYVGMPIVSLEDVNEDDSVVISVLNTNSIIDIYHILKMQGIKHIYWYYDALQNLDGKRGDFFEEQCLNLSGWGDLIMPHIELHISDKCNLNCKGCSHFSPLFDEINAVFANKMKDIKAVKRLFDNIFRIDLLGGEPLLNPELKKYVISLREELPETFIQIYTNGLLIPTLEDDVLEVISRANVGMSISEYLPTHKMINRITEKLDRFHIRYHIAEYDSKQLFNTPISLSEKSKYSQLCISDGCITVSDGKISRCPTLMYIERFNSYFKQNLPTDGIYEIGKYHDGKTLLEDMKKKVPLCKHCIKCDMEWSVCGAEKRIEDFAVDE